MPGGRTALHEGALVLTDTGTALVMAVNETGVEFRDCVNVTTHFRWDALPVVREVRDGVPSILAPALRPLWDSLDDDARSVALNRLEVVQELVPGYRDGHPEFRRPGEPQPPFGDGFGVSIAKRATAMAALLSQEAQADRSLQRRIRDGEIEQGGVNSSTIRNWERLWREQGLYGLIDKRSLRGSDVKERVDARFRELAEQVVGTLDGTRSSVAIQELERQVRAQLRKSGITDLRTPRQATQTYLSNLLQERGTTPRAQRNKVLQTVSGSRQYPAIRPGQVVAIDATRADNLVFDPLTGIPCSVEILTAICVATRVILALRVVPRSANGLEAGLLAYDICRPFSLAVNGSSISEWRWVGLPEQLDLSNVAVHPMRRVVSPDFSTLQGGQSIPSVMPDAIRSDHGSIFVSQHFRALLHVLKIDLLLSRGGKPTDNPHVERWHETLQRAVQQLPGYKGRNVSERGGLVADEPLLTALELQEHLRRFVALDYHRSWHTGLVLHGHTDARLCPLEMWDALVEVTGRIDVPQQPDMIYQFLPVRWGTIGMAGVEFSEMSYDSPILDPFRRVSIGHFRKGDRAAPFFVDPHDLSRIWFRDPDSNRVESVEWRGANRIDAPLTETIVNAALKRVRERGGNNVLNRGSATRQILDELIELTSSPGKAEWKRKIAAAALRVEHSRRDHAEAQGAQNLHNPVRLIAKHRPQPASFAESWPNLLDDG